MSTHSFKIYMTILVCVLTTASLLSCVTSLRFEDLCRDKLMSLAAAEKTYQSSHGKYGYLKDLAEAGLVESGKTSTNMAEGYTLDLLLDEPQSKFIIVATPTTDPALPTYLVDAAQTVVKMVSIQVQDPGRIWKSIMESESMALSEDGHYIFPQIPEYRDQQLALELLLSEEGQSYILLNPTGVGESQPGGELGPNNAYLSSQEKYYRIEPLQ
jgi:hypothetical protein